MEFENDLEEKLYNTSNWPVAVKGQFECVDGGDTSDSGYASWLTGALYISGSDDDLSIMINEEVLLEAKASEDQLEESVYVFWLNGRFEESEDPIVFNVVKIENA